MKKWDLAKVEKVKVKSFSFASGPKSGPKRLRPQHTPLCFCYVFECLSRCGKRISRFEKTDFKVRKANLKVREANSNCEQRIQRIRRFIETAFYIRVCGGQKAQVLRLRDLPAAHGPDEAPRGLRRLRGLRGLPPFKK